MYRNVQTTRRRKRGGKSNKKLLIGGGVLIGLTALLFVAVQDVQPPITTINQVITPSNAQ